MEVKESSPPVLASVLAKLNNNVLAGVAVDLVDNIFSDSLEVDEATKASQTLGDLFSAGRIDKSLFKVRTAIVDRIAKIIKSTSTPSYYGKERELCRIMLPLFVHIDDVREYIYAECSEIVEYLVESEEAHAEATFVLTLVRDLILHSAAKEVPEGLLNELATRQLTSNLEIAKLCNSILCQAISSLTICCPVAFKSIEAMIVKGENYWALAYKLFLKWIGFASTNKKPSDVAANYIKDQMRTPRYWSLLQKGFSANSYEIKKFCLAILTESVNGIYCSLDLPDMRWHEAQTIEYQTEWRRYISLIEIVSIDTSVNQTEDSIGDIVGILRTTSKIPKSWALVLLSSAMNSSMETIRKVVANVLLALDERDTDFFKDEPQFIVEDLLPFAMMAPNFVTLETEPRRYDCPYGNRLAQFVTRLVKSAGNKTGAKLVLEILGFLHQVRLGFDPARLFVLKGLVDGLIDRTILSSVHMQAIKKLSLSTAETRLRKGLLHSYALDLLRSVSWSSVSLAEWLSSATPFLTEDLYTYGEHIIWISSSIVRLDRFEELEQLRDSMHAGIYASIFLRLRPQNNMLTQNDMADQLDMMFEEQTMTIADFNVNDRALSFFTTEKDFGTHLHMMLIGSLCDETPLSDRVGKFLLAWHRRSAYVAECLKRTADYPSIRGQRTLQVSFGLFEKLERVRNGGFEASDFAYDVVRDLRLSALNNDSTALPNESVATAYYVLSKLLPNTIGADTLLTTTLFDTLQRHFQTLGSDVRMNICLVIPHLLRLTGEFTPPTYDFVDEIASLFETMWSTVVDERLAPAERPLHLEILRVIFSDEVMRLRRLNMIEARLEAIAESVITQSYSRRGLVPLLSSLLCKHSDQLWIGRVFVSVYAFAQIDDYLFRLESYFAQVTDDRCDPGASSYTYFNGEREIAAKVRAIEYLRAAEDSAEQLFQYVIGEYSDELLFPRKRTDALEEQRRVQLFQIVLFLEPMQSDEVMHDFVIDALEKALDTEPSPSVRVYIEWLVCRTITRDQNVLAAYELVLDHLRDNPEDEPRIIASRERIGALVGAWLTRVDEKEAVKYYQRFLSELIPLCSSNRAKVRHTSVSLVHALYSLHHKTALMNRLFGSYKTVVGRISNVATSADTFKNYRSDLLWDPEDDMTFLGVCGGVLRRVCGRRENSLYRDEFERYQRYNSVEEDAERDYPTLPPVFEIKPPANRIAADATMSVQIQTKSGAWDVSEDTPESVARGELIVLASLVDKAPNLGGICRLSEVLGAQTMCVNNLAVLKDTHFKGVAVTAEQWMPIEEVKVDAITEYMNLKKLEGYSLIGLEQTDNSIQLGPELKFPRKSLLLLGTEKYGIPGELLAELDFCIEIKQVGVIRSMNIQTATAVVVHEYASQHC